MNIRISDATCDLRALREEVRALAGIEASNIRALPIACGAWRRERAEAAREAYETVLRLIEQQMNRK